jgi:chromosome segregation ATPase
MREADLDRRLPLYAYLEPLLVGRRILEIGKVRESSAEHLLGLGAARVVTADADLAGVQEPFDVVLVPEAEAEVLRPGAVARWRKLLADKGRLVVAVANPERAGQPGGVGYYDLHDAVGPHFSRVQMFGVTPFLGVGLVEFEGAVDGLRVDARLVKPGSEAPSTYVAIGGADPVAGLGYALVQLPWGTLGARPGLERAAGATLHDGAGGELRRKLEEMTSQAESAMRVARAQGDEIDELRARLRRAAEDRAGLDAEIAKLRRGLADADEAVVSLTRRTADEMAVIAERLASGLRGPSESQARAAMAEVAAARDEADRLRGRLGEAEARAAAAEQRLEAVGSDARQRQAELEDALERLRLADNDLGRARRTAARLEEEARTAAVDARGLEETMRALAARDERIARLEAEKQDLVWRLAELEDKLRAAIARAVRTEGARAAGAAVTAVPPAALGAAAAEDLAAARDARERALEGFHRAAAAHVGELTELKASVAEQTALVAELEDALAAAESRAATASAEATTLRRTAKDFEEADRSRRSRLAELEGKLLRLEHERRASAGGNGAGNPRVSELEAESEQLRRRIENVEAERVAWQRERDGLRGQLESQARAVGGRNGHDPAAALAGELEAIESALRAEAVRLDAFAAEARAGGVGGFAGGSQAGAGGDPGRLEATLGNYRERAGRLRDDLEGIRRRLDSLSPSEIAGFLEELGEDLAELER